MALFEKQIQIDAISDAEATAIAKAMVKMMKAVRKETSTNFFIELAEKINAKPKLIIQAKSFLRW